MILSYRSCFLVSTARAAFADRVDPFVDSVDDHFFIILSFNADRFSPCGRFCTLPLQSVGRHDRCATLTPATRAYKIDRLRLRIMPLSQQINKSSGTCSVCFATWQVHVNGGTIHKHEPRHDPYPGSNRPTLQACSQTQTPADQPTTPPTPHRMTSQDQLIPVFTLQCLTIVGCFQPSGHQLIMP